MKLRRPLGLLLAGGGAHGAWQAAVVDIWARERGLTFDHILGFSIGSLTGAGYSLDRLNEVLSVFRNIDSHRILRFRPRLNPFALFGNDSLREVLRYGGDEVEAKRRLRCRFTVIGYCLEDRRHEYFQYSPQGRDGWDAPYADHLLASCSIPTIFPPVRLSRNGRAKTFVDGGTPGPTLPSFEALRDCRDVIVLQMIRHDEIGLRPWGFFARREQSNRESLYEFISEGLRPLLESERDRRVFRFYPSQRLNFSMLSFKDIYTRPALELGRRDAAVFLDDPARYRIL